MYLKIIKDKFGKVSSSGAVFAVFIFSLLIRVWGLSSIPHSFHIDEVISGYMGRFILLNGKDVYGNTFPLFYFNSFGDFRTILPMYINGLSTFIFGVNEFAVRFPTALVSSLIVFPVFSLSKLLFGNRKFSLLPPLLISVLPWHIVLSRATSEAALGLTVIALGLMFLLKSVVDEKPSDLIFSVVFFALAYFIYPSFRILVPLIMLPIPFFAVVKKRWWYLFSLIFFVVLTLVIAATPYGKGRYQQTSFLASSELASRIKAKNTALSYAEGADNILVSRVFHNKAVGYFQEFSDQYLSYFSPGFLFIHGGLPDRYVVPDTGLIYLFFAVFLLGLLLPVSLKIRDRIFYYMLYLLLIAPVPAALTVEDVPNINRGIFLSLIFIFFISIGALKLFIFLENKNKVLVKIFSSAAVILITCEFIFFQHQYFVISPIYKSVLRNDGIKELIGYLEKYENKKVILPLSNMPVYYLFYHNNFNKDISGKFSPGLNIKNIGNVNFIGSSCTKNEYQLTEGDLINTIIVEDGECIIGKNFEVLKIIYRNDSTKAYRIIKPVSLTEKI